MDRQYSDPNRKTKKFAFALIILVLGALIGVGYFFLQSQKNLVSPLPVKPSFELIFYTPTPSETTPTSTPSATPKAVKKAAATVTPKPSVSISVTPLASSTVKPTLKPTIKLSPSP